MCVTVVSIAKKLSETNRRMDIMGYPYGRIENLNLIIVSEFFFFFASVGLNIYRLITQYTFTFVENCSNIRLST